MKKTGIYIHIPFCVSKCVYCDFLSAPPADNEQIKRYISSLAEEIKTKASSVSADLKITDSVFFGGGTPTLLKAEELIFILKNLRKFFLFTKDAEISVECNPGTAAEKDFKELKQGGINRISFGLQSAIDTELNSLGRIHTFAEFKNSFKQARAAGFDNINIDIISAIPGQTLDSFRETLEKVTELKPEHISCYSLILEEGTRLFECLDEFAPLPEEDEERQMYDEACSFLAGKGYLQYEISNFCRKDDKNDFRCRHNLGYWERAAFLGFGAGAASFDGKVRYKNISDVEDYIKSPGKEDVQEREFITKEEATSEFMFLGLRKTEGISEEKFFKEFGISLDAVFGKIIKGHMQDGLMEKTSNGYRLTKRGVEVSNSVFSDYLL